MGLTEAVKIDDALGLALGHQGDAHGRVDLHQFHTPRQLHFVLSKYIRHHDGFPRAQDPIDNRTTVSQQVIITPTLSLGGDLEYLLGFCVNEDKGAAVNLVEMGEEAIEDLGEEFTKGMRLLQKNGDLLQQPLVRIRFFGPHQDDIVFFQPCFDIMHSLYSCRVSLLQKDQGAADADGIPIPDFTFEAGLNPPAIQVRPVSTEEILDEVASLSPLNFKVFARDEDVVERDVVIKATTDVGIVGF